MDWIAAFQREAVPDQPTDDVAAAVDRGLADGGGFRGYRPVHDAQDYFFTY